MKNGRLIASFQLFSNLFLIVFVFVCILEVTPPDRRSKRGMLCFLTCRFGDCQTIADIITSFMAPFSVYSSSISLHWQVQNQDRERHWPRRGTRHSRCRSWAHQSRARGACCRQSSSSIPPPKSDLLCALDWAEARAVAQVFHFHLRPLFY